VQHYAARWPQELTEVRRRLGSLLHGYTPELSDIKAPVLPIHGCYQPMVPFEVSSSILNYIADSRRVLSNDCGTWPPLGKAGRVDRAGRPIARGHSSRGSGPKLGECPLSRPLAGRDAEAYSHSRLNAR